MLLFLALVGSLLMFILTLKKTEYSLFLLLLIIPLFPKIPFLKLSGTYIPIRIEDFFIFFVVLALLYKVFKREIDLTNRLNKWVILFLGIGLLSTVIGILTGQVKSPLLGVLHYLRRIEYVSMFYISFSTIKDLQQVRKVVKCIIFTLALVLIYGVLQRFNLAPIFTSMFHDYFFGRPVYFFEYHRVISTFSGPYDFAAYLVVMVLFTGALFFVAANVKEKITYIILIFVSLILIYMTYSRTPLVALAVGIFLLFALSRKWKWLIPVIGLAAIPVFFFKDLLIRLSSTGILKRPPTVSYEQAMSGISQGFDMSAYVRFYYNWPKAIKAFLQHPILGKGYSSLGEAVDGDYLRLLGETGVLGLFSFAMMIFVILKMELSNIKRAEDKYIKFLSLGILVSSIALLIDAVFIDIFEASKIACYFWVFTGIAFKINQLITINFKGEKAYEDTPCISNNN